ncbi:MAG: hypothetical protein WCL06_00080 [Bacteroidota bacterium]
MKAIRLWIQYKIVGWAYWGLLKQHSSEKVNVFILQAIKHLNTEEQKILGEYLIAKSEVEGRQ